MKKLLKKIMMSLLSFLAILIYQKVIFKDSSFDFIYSLCYFLIFIFYYKYSIELDKKTKVYSFLLSGIISLFLAVGSIVSSYIFEPAVNIFQFKNIVYCLVCFLGFFSLFYNLFGIMLKKITKYKLVSKKTKMSKKQYFGITLLIFLGYFLYFIRFYPAIMTSDSYYVIHYANNFILSDFHAFGHTWFFGLFFHIGKFLFGNLNSAVAFFTIIQMLCMSFVFSYSIKFLYENGLKKVVCVGLLLFYLLNPLYAHYSITLWRDVLFGASFVLLIISLYNFLDSNNIKFNYILLFIVSVLMLMFFRNNGIYIFLFLIPFLIIILTNKRKFMIILSVILVCFYFGVKGPVFDYFKVEKTTSVEAFSIPLQQMARVVASGRDINDKDKKYLKKLFEYDKISDSYRNSISDPVKNITNNDFLSENKSEFFSTYLSLFFKYPNVYVEAYFLQTLGYWYPDVIYWATAGESKGIFKEEKVYSSPLTPEWYNNIIDMTTSRKIPLSNLIWSVALPFLILIISAFVMVYNGDKKYLLCYVPLFGLWLSIVVASPVFCELRYVYGLFTSLPIVLFLPVIVNKKMRRRKND